MARDFSVFVNIGGKLNASLGAAVKGAESALVGVGRAASQGAAETTRAFAGASAGASRSLGRIAADSGRLGRSLRSVGGWGDRFSRDLEKLKVAPREFARVEKSWTSLQKALSTAPRNAAFQLGAIKEWENATLAALRRVDRAQVRVRSNFGSIAGGVGGAYTARRMGRATVSTTADAATETSRDYLGGISDGDSERLRKSAEDLSRRFPSLDATTLHERLRDTAQALRSVDKSIAFGDVLARGQVVLESLKGRSAAIEEGRKFFKGLDVIGVDDPARMKQLFDGWTKALGVEGADLDMGGFLQMIRQSRNAGASLNDRFLTLIAPQLAQDLGDSQLGTSLASAASQLIAGRSTKTAKALQEQYGLRDASGEYIDKRGLQTDPFEHLMKTVLPALQKRGVDINDNKALADLFQNLFSNRTVSDVFTKMATQRDQILSKIANYEKAPGLAGADRLLAKDPTTAFSALTAQTTNLINALTNPLVPAATDAMNGLATGIGKLASALAGNKDVAAIAGLGSAAAVAGGSAWLSWRGVKAAGEWLGGGAAGAASKAPALPFEAVTKGGPSILASIGKTLGLGVAALGVNAATKSVTGRDPLAEATALIDRVKGGSLTGEDRGNIVASQNALRKALGLEGFFARIEGKAEPKAVEGAYGRDFTLGSKGGFSRTGTVTPPSRVGYMSNWDAKHVAPGPIGQSVDIAKQFDEQVSRIEDAGRQSGLKFSSALALELSKAETATTALALRLKSALSFTASPVVSLRIGGATAAAGQSIAGERAGGGPVMGGKTYLVGEKGPELFRAPMSGEIVPNHRLQRLTAPEMIARATAPQDRTVTIGDTSVTVSITAQGDPEAIARAAARAVREEIRRLQDQQHALLSD